MIVLQDIVHKSQFDLLIQLINDLKEGHFNQIDLLKDLIKACLPTSEATKVRAIVQNLIEYASQGVTANDSNLIYLCGYFRCNGIGMTKKYPQAIVLFEKAIKLGNTFAMIDRAYMYQWGIGSEQSYPKAIALYERAMRLGNSLAMVYRALMYQDAQGEERNCIRAIELYEQAIKLGNTHALRNRASMCQNENPARAIELYELAINQGNVWAMIVCAQLYNSRGSLRSYSKAIALYDLAIKLNNQTAKIYKAKMLKAGLYKY